MEWSFFVAIAAFAFIASFIQRVTGFGYGIVFMSFAPYLMPSYAEATALSGALAIICAAITALNLNTKYLSQNTFPQMHKKRGD